MNVQHRTWNAKVQEDMCAIASTDHNPKQTRKYDDDLINKRAIKTTNECATATMKMGNVSVGKTGVCLPMCDIT